MSRLSKGHKTRKNRRKTRTKTKVQRGGMWGFSNNDKIIKLLKEHPEVDITEMCLKAFTKQVNLLGQLGVRSALSNSFVEKSSLDKFQEIRDINHKVDASIQDAKETYASTTASFTPDFSRFDNLEKQRQDIMDTFRAEIKQAIAPTS